MEFCLHYNGPLRSDDGIKGKHEIRSQLDPQIRSLAKQDSFHLLLRDDLENKRRPPDKPMFLEASWKKVLVSCQRVLGHGCRP